MESATKKRLLQDAAAILAFAILLYFFGSFVFSSDRSSNQVFIHEKVLLSPPPAVHNVRPLDAQDHVLGNRNAPVLIIEYSDLECPYCKVNHFNMRRILEEYEGDVVWVFRHHPLDHVHAKGRVEAEATECVASLGGGEAFWSFLDEVYRVTPSNDGLDLSLLPELASKVGVDEVAFTECLDGEAFEGRVQGDITNAKQSGLSFTPSMIVIWPDGETKSLIIGARQYDTIKAVLNIILGREDETPAISGSEGDNFSQ